MGHEGKRRQETAFHEAGHAAMALTLGRPIRRIVMTPNEEDGSEAAVHQHRQPTFLNDLDFYLGNGWKKAVPKLLSLFAGPVSQQMFTGEWDHVGAASDNEQIFQIVERVTINDAEAAALRQWAFERTKNLLRRPDVWRRVRLIAAELMTRDTITGKDVSKIVTIDMADREWPKRLDDEMAEAARHLARIEKRQDRAAKAKGDKKGKAK